ncbi:putative reverse transcriptase domain-containing protein [Tanacetum coccineum]
MTSLEDVCFDVVKDTKVKVMKSKVRKPHKGKRIKVSTLGSSSAGAGSMLKKLRSFKISGKARDRAESSPSDNKGGKRVVSSSENDVIHKVLSDVRSGSLTNDNIVACFPLNKDSNIIGLNPANDFIKDPLLPLNDPSLNKDSNSIGLSLVASGSNPKDRMDFKFGKVSNSKGILKKPMSPLLNVQLGSDIPNPFVKGVGGNNTEEMALKMEYMPSARSKLDNGTSMDYRVVRANLMRMWKTYGIVDITKTNSGIFYFKFKSEEVKPSFIPIWFCVYNIPLKLCNGSSISKIMSGIGKPLLMDKMTKDRCLKKAGKLDFTRVLVEVSAVDELLMFWRLLTLLLGILLLKLGSWK